MEKKNMTRREAIRAMVLAGAGLAAGSSLVGAPLRASGVLPQEWKTNKPAEGDKVFTRNWKSLGDTVGTSDLGKGLFSDPIAPTSEKLHQETPGHPDTCATVNTSK